MSKEIGVDIDLEFVEANFTGNSWAGCVALIEAKGNTTVPENFEQEYRRRSAEAFTKEIQPMKGIPESINSLNLSLIHI